MERSYEIFLRYLARRVNQIWETTVCAAPLKFRMPKSGASKVEQAADLPHLSAVRNPRSL
jgi:hypothetical protein